MSLQKVHTVQRAAKDQGLCSRCRKPLVKGEPYIWWPRGFRQGKVKRCADAACAPRLSERESSSLSEIYAAQEDLERSVSDAETGDDLTAAYDAYVEAVEEYASGRREAADAWENGNSQLEEAAEAAEGAASELYGAWELEEYPGKMRDDGTPKNAEKYQAWLTEQADAMSDVVEGVEVGA